MAQRVRALHATVAAVIAILAPSAARAQETLQPPYVDVTHTEFCSNYNVLDSCIVETDPVAATGRISAGVTLTAPSNGTLLGRGDGAATATIDTGHSSDGTMRGVTYLFHVRVDEAVLQRTGALYGPGKPFTGDGDIALLFEVRPHKCPGCTEIVRVPLLSEGSGRVLARDLSLQIAVPLPICTASGLVPAGTIWVRATAVVNQSHGFGRTFVGNSAPFADTGTSIGRFEGALERVDITETDPAPCDGGF